MKLAEIIHEATASHFDDILVPVKQQVLMKFQQSTVRSRLPRWQHYIGFKCKKKKSLKLQGMGKLGPVFLALEDSMAREPNSCSCVAKSWTMTRLTLSHHGT